MQYSKEVLQRHKVLSMVLNGLLNIKQASRELNLSYRHTQRVLKQFLSGDMSLNSRVYKRTHLGENKLDESLEEKDIVIQIKLYLKQLRIILLDFPPFELSRRSLR